MLLLHEIKKLHNLKSGDEIIHTYSGQKFKVNDADGFCFRISAVEESSKGLSMYSTSGILLNYAFIVDAIINNEYGSKTRYIFKTKKTRNYGEDYIKVSLNV